MRNNATMAHPLPRKISLADRSAWTGALARTRHAFAHTWDCCTAMQETTGHPTYLYVDEAAAGTVVCPLSERSFEGHTDVYTPLGFSGLASDGAGSGHSLARWGEFARAQGYVCAYLTVNPLFAPAQCSSSCDYVAYNDLHVLDLTMPQEALLRAMSKGRRAELRMFERTGASLTHDRGRLEDFLLAHFSQFMRERGASQAAQIRSASLSALCRSESVFLIGAQIDGEVVAVALYGHSAFCADGMFSICLPAGRGTMTTLIWEGALHLKALNIPLLNLGGGIAREDGVAMFKKQFGARTLPLGALRQVFRRDVYDALCGSRPASVTNYFPAYRA